MQIFIEMIRKIVVLVLLMEVILQLQSGRQYESYIKILIGIMVVYSVVQGVFGAWDTITQTTLAPMQEFQWSEEWFATWQKQAEEFVEEEEDKETIPSKSKIYVEPIEQILPITVNVDKKGT